MKKQRIKILILSTILLIIPIIISLTLFLYNNSLEKIITIFGSKEEYDLISCFSLWWYLFRYDLFSYIAYLLPIIITIMSCYSFFHLYRSGTIFNIIQREKYSKLMIKEILLSWSKNIILPIIMLLFFIISIILFPNTHVFDLTGRLAYIYQIGHPYMNIINPFLFVFLYLAIVFLFGIIITNLGIILTRFIKKFNLLVIGNFILVIIIESIGNFIVGPIVKSLTGYDRMANGFSLYNIYYLDAIPSLWWEFLFSIITIIITSIIIYLIYKDKEKVLNSYE